MLTLLYFQSNFKYIFNKIVCKYCRVLYYCCPKYLIAAKALLYKITFMCLANHYQFQCHVCLYQSILNVEGAAKQCYN